MTDTAILELLNAAEEAAGLLAVPNQDEPAEQMRAARRLFAAIREADGVRAADTVLRADAELQGLIVSAGAAARLLLASTVVGGGVPPGRGHAIAADLTEKYGAYRLRRVEKMMNGPAGDPSGERRAAAVAAIRAAATRPKRYSFGNTGLQDIIR